MTPTSAPSSQIGASSVEGLGFSLLAEVQPNFHGCSLGVQGFGRLEFEYQGLIHFKVVLLGIMGILIGLTLLVS